MNKHLSSQQIDDALSGRPSQTTALHLDACEACAGELAALRETLGNFRVATTAAAAHHRRFVAATPRRLPRMAWALAAAALFMSIAAPVAVHRRSVTPIVAPGSQDSATVSDEALLSDVQNDLSSSVPESLLPLAGTSTNTTKSTATPRNDQ
jgi:hypothetical protein